jgi:microcystin-dependent protein
MAEPFLSEIRIMSFGFPPKGWALCDGQLLPINQNQALFSLLGTTYGGDGRVNFGLPDLQGRLPMHMGQSHTLGERGGEAAHTLTIAEVPMHGHSVQVSNTTGSQPVPADAFPAAAPELPYAPVDNNLAPMKPGTVASIGGSQAHLNQQPFLVLNFSIALQGIFPSQN